MRQLVIEFENSKRQSKRPKLQLSLLRLFIPKAASLLVITMSMLVQEAGYITFPKTGKRFITAAAGDKTRLFVLL